MSNTIKPDRVRAARTALGLSQSQLGERVGRRQTTIQALETGRVERPGFALELATALGVSVEWLYGATDDPRPANIGPQKQRLLDLIEQADPADVDYLLGILERLQQRAAG